MHIYTPPVCGIEEEELKKLRGYKLMKCLLEGKSPLEKRKISSKMKGGEKTLFMSYDCLESWYNK